MKLLLIQALRNGRVQGKSIDEVLFIAFQRHDKEIKWTDGMSPVICSIRNGNLNVNVSGTSELVTNAVTNAGKLAGVVGTLIGHDVRRGSARDVSRLGSGSSLGTATDGVAAAIGHSRRSLAAGTTRRYVGKSNVDLWERRVREVSEDAFDVQVARNPMPKRKRLSKDEVDILCERYQKDKNSRLERHQATRLHHKEAHRAWVNAAKDETAVRTPLAPMSGNVRAPLALGRENGAPLVPENELVDPALANIDPRLHSDGGLNFDDPNMAAEYVLDTANDDDAHDLCGSPIEFVRRFSRINITTRDKDDVYTGGHSRDEPVGFMRSCTTPGCEFAANNRNVLSIHQASCTEARLVYQQQLSAIKGTFHCRHEDCNRTFTSRDRASSHFKSVHEKFSPRTCSDKECNQEIIYNTLVSYRKHRSEAHSSYTPTRCTVEGCTSEHVFRWKSGLTKHIYLHHRTAEERDAKFMARHTDS